MLVKVYNRQKALKISKTTLSSIVKALLKKERADCDEVIIHIVDAKKICQLHDRFFQDPSQTDCITFPIDGPKKNSDYTVLGEVFICSDTALEYASNRGLDPMKELTLYLVHALLHLLGYDDIDPKDRRVMRKKEKSCMEFLDRELLKL